VIQEKTLEFIRKHRDTAFFAFIPMVIPHAELLVPDDGVLQSVIGSYPETPYLGRPGADYGPEMKIGMYCSQEHPRATFAAMVMRLDRHVGEIIETLEELGLEENTIVIFSSDNGPHREGGADPAFFESSGGLRGIKRDLYEGGIRVPMIAWWPGTIEGGRISNHISAFWDVAPTLVELAGGKPFPSDGISFRPELSGELQTAHEYLYWEFHEQGGKQAILKDGFKAIRLGVGEDPDGPLELYDLEEDPFESANIASEHPDLADQFSRLMEEARIPSEIFRFGAKTYSGE
jgi:arylsulfatase A-like enzyme